MNIYVRADLEGVTGVVSYEQTEPGKSEYAYGQRMLVSDINAAVKGCFDAGASRVVVYDMHCTGRNIPLDQFDARAELICGKPKLAKDFISRFDAMMLVGFHGKAGSGTLLAHSYEGDTLDIRINGLSVGEIGMEAALAGECGVPLVLVTGDSAGCAEARKLVPGIRTVEVKTSMSPCYALCLPPLKTAEMIRTAAAEAAPCAGKVKPFSIGPFKSLEVELPSSECIQAERLRQTPTSHWEGTTLAIQAASLFEAWQTYRLLRETS